MLLVVRMNDCGLTASLESSLAVDGFEISEGMSALSKYEYCRAIHCWSPIWVYAGPGEERRAWVAGRHI